MAGSPLAVYGAIAANVGIAVTKFIVAGLTGSSAMLSEGIHSAVDTGNGLLLLVGMKLSQRPPSAEHPFGHGKELYFWSLIVAVLIFGLGGGISVYEGLLHMRHPAPIESAGWNYAVLGIAALFEGSSFTVALREFWREKGERPFWQALRSSKDPTTYTVLAEDSAALVGLALAALGIFASRALDLPVLDGLASLLIGVLLAAVAVLLIRESRGLLVGEGLRPETLRAIREIAQADPRVRRVGRPLSMYIGPEEVLLTLDVEFDPSLPSDEVVQAVESIEHQIRERWERIRRIYIEARRSVQAAAPAAAN